MKPTPFILVLITPESMLPEEQAILTAILEEAACDTRENLLIRVHVRKPFASSDKLAQWLAAFSPAARRSMSVHQHHHLAAAWGVGGIHLKSQARRNWTAADWQHWLGQGKESGLRLSISAHGTDDLSTFPDGLDYVLLSPVFDSISKPDYRGKPDLQVPNDLPFPVLGLGGVQAENIGLLSPRGFNGAAVLGTIWQETPQALSQWRQLKLACRSSVHTS